MTNEDYIDIAYEKREGILHLYSQFKGKRPVMLYDLQEGLVYAYPYKEYKATLSKRSQNMLTKQYKAAIATKETVIFVRDNEKEKLISFTADLESDYV